MNKHIQLFFCLIMGSMAPITTFSLTAADFNKKIAETSQANSPSFSPQYNYPTNTNAPASTQTPNTQAPPAPIYYAPATPSINANPAAAPTTTPAAPASNSSIWGASSSGSLNIGY